MVALPGLFLLHTTPVVFVPCGDPRKSPLNVVIFSSARVCTLKSPFVFLFLMILIYKELRFVIVALPGVFSYLFYPMHLVTILACNFYSQKCHFF